MAVAMREGAADIDKQAAICYSVWAFHEEMPQMRPTETFGSSSSLALNEFLGTFQFSQGDMSTQREIVRYIKWLRPELRMTPQQQEHLALLSIRPIQTILGLTGRHRSVATRSLLPDMAADGARIALRDIALILNSPLSQTKEAIVQDLAHHFLAQDLRFLEKPYGRDYQPHYAGHYNPYRDSWRSDLCYFGFLGHTTGLTNFDQLFADVAAYWRLHWQDSDNPEATKLKRVIAIFNEHHSGLRIPLLTAS